MRRLIEHARRRPDFAPDRCRMIKLSDGQPWAFPRPWLELTPVVDGEITLPSGAATPEATRFTRNFTLGEELDLLIEAIALEEDPARRIVMTMTLGALLLRRHYDLEDAELERLFVYRAGDPESEAMVREIMAVATGNAAAFAGDAA